MARPRKNPAYDSARIIQQLMDEMKEAYLNPCDAEDLDGHMQLKRLSEEFSMTPLKARKLLITAGVYETPTSTLVNHLKNQGKTIAEIQELTGLGRASVHGYLPYSKIVYNLDELSMEAERLRKYRARKSTVAALEQAVSQSLDAWQTQFWQAIEEFVGYPFQTRSGRRYSYQIQDEHLAFSIKSEPISKQSIRTAAETALALRQENISVTNPEILSCENVEYLYPVFVRLHLIEAIQE